jgi:hypothetical protein
MYARGLKHFYIDEVCRLSDGQLVIPLAWIKRGGLLCADSRLITSTMEVIIFTLWLYQILIRAIGWLAIYRWSCPQHSRSPLLEHLS